LSKAGKKALMGGSESLSEDDDENRTLQAGTKNFAIYMKRKNVKKGDEDRPTRGRGRKR
jgi:hypothetical protein